MAGAIDVVSNAWNTTTNGSRKDRSEFVSCRRFCFLFLESVTQHIRLKAIVMSTLVITSSQSNFKHAAVDCFPSFRWNVNGFVFYSDTSNILNAHYYIVNVVQLYIEMVRFVATGCCWDEHWLLPIELDFIACRRSVWITTTMAEKLTGNRHKNTPKQADSIIWFGLSNFNTFNRTNGNGFVCVGLCGWKRYQINSFEWIEDASIERCGRCRCQLLTLERKHL